MKKPRKSLQQQKQPEASTSSSGAPVETPAPSRSSDQPPPKRKKWVNRQRVLVFSSRGIHHRGRHLMLDLRNLLAHAKPETKLEKKEALSEINEICEIKNCNKCVYFECKRQGDLYMWVSNTPRGPSAKFLIENIHTMNELRLTGNCLKGSRPILSFDKNFSASPHYELLRELFTQAFSVPYHHPKSQPFIDHVFTFSILDNRIWFRNYQIVEETGALAEIGPRFCLNPIKVFQGSFGGVTLWQNPKFVTPAMNRRLLKQTNAGKYADRVKSKVGHQKRKMHYVDPAVETIDSVFE